MITVSLETAKKLKEAGRKKKTAFYYKVSDKGGIKLIRNYCLYGMRAPTAQEILDDLPMYIDTKSNEYGSIILSMEGSATRRACFYSDFRKQSNYQDVFFVGDTLAESVAQMRMRCKENGYLSF